MMAKENENRRDAETQRRAHRTLLELADFPETTVKAVAFLYQRSGSRSQVESRDLFASLNLQSIHHHNEDDEVEDIHEKDKVAFQVKNVLEDLSILSVVGDIPANIQQPNHISASIPFSIPINTVRVKEVWESYKKPKLTRYESTINCIQGLPYVGSGLGILRAFHPLLVVPGLISFGYIVGSWMGWWK